MLQALTRSGEAETAKALLGQKLQHACMLASVAGQLQIATVRCGGVNNMYIYVIHYIHAYIRSYIHAYIHTYIYTCILHIHIYIRILYIYVNSGDFP
jgi:hypothetical protein